MAAQLHDLPPLSENHAKRLRVLKQKKHRDHEQTFLVEGLRLCEEAVSAGTDIFQAVFTREALDQPRIAELLHKIVAQQIPTFLASPRLFNSLSDEPSPQGILFAMKKKAVLSVDNMSDRLVLACENVQDPGNLGTIFRTAEWFGVHTIFLSPGCVEAHNPKVVRGSMGAIFRLNIIERVDLNETLPQLKMKGYRLIGTTLDASTRLADIQPGTDVLLIGNEANGLSAAVLPLVDERVTIPGAGGGDSLNAAIAASICLYHLSQA